MPLQPPRRCFALKLRAERLFITDDTEFVEDLHRNGNSTHPRFDRLRPEQDAHAYEVDGVKRIKDRRPGFENPFLLAPAFNMRLAEYVELLEQIRPRCN